MTPEQKEKLIDYIKKFKKKDYFRAVHYCHGYIRMREKVFKTVTPDDFIMIVLGKFYEGKRKYDDCNYDSFIKSFYYNLRSEIKNWFRLNKKYMNSEDLDEVYEKFEAEEFGTDDCNFIGEHAEIIFRGIEDKQLKDAVLNIITNTDDKKILDQFLLGKNNQQTAEALGIKIPDVENAKKRIYRAVRNKLNKEFLEGRVTWAA